MTDNEHGVDKAQDANAQPIMTPPISQPFVLPEAMKNTQQYESLRGTAAPPLHHYKEGAAHSSMRAHKPDYYYE